MNILKNKNPIDGVSSSDSAQTGPIIHTINAPGTRVEAIEDSFSDRIRCDHPGDVDGVALGHALRDLAEDSGRGRIITFVRPDVADGLQKAGYVSDGRLPGFYQGTLDCVVMGLATDPGRQGLANRIEVGRVDALLNSPPRGRSHAPIETRRADTTDAVAIAQLMDDTFDDYPTPSSDPAYVADQIEQGTPFRVVVDDKDDIVACASADLLRDAKTAELTDCATHPEHRGRGYMQCILEDLMSDVGALGYPTVFTMARARIPGVNLAFQRLGFSLRGRMKQSCRIGDGIEDMNIWSRPTATTAKPD
jgi:putative beta-lysine N-acetyltransferase